MAHVEKRGPGRWRARYRGPDSRERSKTFPRKVDAERWLVQVEAAKGRGDWVDPVHRKILMGELIARLIATKQDPNTRAWYRTMGRHALARWETVPVSAVEHLDVQDWIHELEGSVGPDTVRGAYRVLHESVVTALRSRYISHDPCLGVRLPKVNRRDMLFLTSAQVVKLADTMDRTWRNDTQGRPRTPALGWGLLVRFAAYSGCRAGEIGALKVKHLDLLRHRANITESRKRYGTDGPTKTGRSR